MLTNFDRDLAIGHKGEQIVLENFQKLTNDYIFENVSNFNCFFYQGDIKITNKETGKTYFLEVKNDSVIHKTHNVLCEEEVYYKKHDYYGRGNMSGDSDFFTIVSEPDTKIYVLDFKKLKSYYRRGTYKRIDHPAQYSDVYLCHINDLKHAGVVVAIVDYTTLEIESF